jgi:hypothetical protein
MFGRPQEGSGSLWEFAHRFTKEVEKLNEYGHNLNPPSGQHACVVGICTDTIPPLSICLAPIQRKALLALDRTMRIEHGSLQFCHDLALRAI